jgi:hypothetical protein
MAEAPILLDREIADFRVQSSDCGLISDWRLQQSMAISNSRQSEINLKSEL